MPKLFSNVPKAYNEPTKDYAPGSTDRLLLKKALSELKSTMVEIPMYINGNPVYSGNKVRIFPPHEIQHTLGYYHKGGESHVKMAIDAALNAKEAWESMDWRDRAAIFLKAASLISGKYRYKIVAATMLGQSKSAHQAEIDAGNELPDFLRYNVEYLTDIYEYQPKSTNHEWNRIQQRALEGFVFALSPFNFTAIGGNLPTAPAMAGNTVVWKAAEKQIYSAAIIMEILMEAGLPPGVINLVHVSGQDAGRIIFNHSEFAGIHYTGSTEVFQTIWKQIVGNIERFKSYPRIVGETGGKNFVLAHESAGVAEVVTAIVRGGFEYQGQKCSAASRIYLPTTLWPEIQSLLLDQLSRIKIGTVENFSNFMNAVIDEKAFEKIVGYIEKARKAESCKIIYGGGYNKETGYFIEPTVILTTDPYYETMREEIFGPVVTIYLYDPNKYNEVLDLIDRTAVYGLTGSLFARDRHVIVSTTHRLRHAAGNYYINDKPTGAVVGRQPFGGARGSGTNDKAGGAINLYRWLSPRTIKENFLPPTDFQYPFMQEE